MRVFVPMLAFVLFVFGLALTADRNEISAAPDVVALPVDGDCCGDACDCCDKCQCGKPEQAPKPKPQKPKASPKPQPLQTGYYDGTSGWTYPGDIAGHLMGGSHGVSRQQLQGMTKDQMESLHDSLHNSTRTSGQAVAVQSSNCPGGVCPQPTVRRRVWRWRR